MAYTGLTSEQLNILDFAKSGHNVCIFGRAGVGKSTVVQEIKASLEKQGKRCQIVCASGIACDTYHGLATTVHSYYGLQTAELPQSMLLGRSLERANIVEQIENIDVLIWDEISMSSRRIFNLVNLLHQETSKNPFPFGGIQVILAGDFWQLKPIRSILDSGEPVYESELFREVFSHRFELTKILRQEDSETCLKEALDALRNGRSGCDDETERYFCSLSRHLPTILPSALPTHIYFKRLPVEVHNATVLASLPGEKLTFESSDTGYAKLLDKTVSEVLYLKPGCKVMLLYNISQHLKNGIRGEFVGVGESDEELLVNFPSVGVVGIQRRIWYKYDSSGKVRASRTQFPLTLCYAVTTHKAQGLTMSQIVVHCSPEFIPGQTYVAISRVKHENDVKVIGFRKNFLLPPPPQLTQFVTASSGDPVPTYRCCRKIEVGEECNFAAEPTEETCSVDHENGASCESSFESEAKKFFETAEGVSRDLDDLLLCMSDFTHELSHPPLDFNVKTFLEKSNRSSDSFSKSIKSATDYALNNLNTFNLLSCVLWCRIASIFDDHLTDNVKSMTLTNKKFTCTTGKLHELFVTNDYRSDVISAFNVEKWADIDDGQRSLAAQLLFYLYGLFTSEVEKRVRKQEEQDPVCFEVNEMEAEGKGKVRYIGGWAVRKSLEKSRRYAEGNKHSDTKAVCDRVKKEMKKVNLLENNVIVPFSILNGITSNPETLHVTESRQFRERGLLHISDGAHAFFMSLEQERVNNINLQKLKDHQANMVDESIKVISSNKTLNNQFGKLFVSEEDEDQVIMRFCMSHLYVLWISRPEKQCTLGYISYLPSIVL
jgi:hypothetical protein